MKYDEIVAAWDAQKVRFHTWETLPDRERIEFALSLSGKVEKQGPVAEVRDNPDDKGNRHVWGLLYDETIPNGTKLYTAPQPCPECAERKTTALNYISLTFEFEQLQAACEKLKAERDANRDMLESVRIEIEMLREALGVPAEPHQSLSDRMLDAAKERDELAAQVEKMREALEEVDGLIGESAGIYGLHLNGDPSPWDELLKEGRFERLSTLYEALVLPDLSTSALNRVRAEALRKAADIFESQAIGSANMSSIRALAADMEAGK